MAVYNQLNLLDDFDKYERRDERLVNELVRSIYNLKYIRINVRFSELKKKDEIEEVLNQVLYWTAWIAWKKAKFIPQYKDNHKLDVFIAMTKEASGLNITESLSEETLTQYFMNVHRRTRTTFMAYKDILQNENTATRRILGHLEQLHNLT